MHQNHLNQSQRMQLKAFICVLGLLLLVILGIARLVLFFIQKEPEPAPHVPVIEMFANVWIMEADADKILIFQDGAEHEYTYTLSKTVKEEILPEERTLEQKLQQEQEEEIELIAPEQMREQVADIVVTDGVVTTIQVKKDKINAKVLCADASGVELEGYGKLLFSEDYKGYRLYQSLEMCSYEDLLFGYNYADFVMDGGKICGILMVKEGAMEYIRALIKASDFNGLFHEQLEVTSDTDFRIQYGSYDNRQIESHTAGEVVVIGQDSSYFQGESVELIPEVLTGKIILQNVNRSQGKPGYRGHMELHRTENGIVAVNEVLLEEYLYSVVPSEMPASYPDEALQAQAVCARTYAYGHMRRAGYPQYGAHVDDSTSYQVYNNILEQESTTTAVKETYGQLLYTPEGGLAGTYYYSTSCGVGTDATIWKTEEAKAIGYLKGKAINQRMMELTINDSGDAVSNLESNIASDTEEANLDLGELLREETAFTQFITQTNEDDFEVKEGWYRWTYEVPEINLERMLGLLQKRYDVNNKLVLTLQDGEYVSEPIEELDVIHHMFIEKRGSGGIADELVIETAKHTYKVISEHNIRYILNNGESKVVRQDGSQVAANTLLPSAFFILNASKEGENVIGYTLSGGGFGHGVGMSQNGARSMAKSGYTYEQILAYFYEDCILNNVYEQ